MAQAHPAVALSGAPPAERVAAGSATRTAGVLFFILGAQFMTAIMLAASIAPSHDFSAGAISDLGVVSETALLFNASLVAVGILNLAGGALCYRSHRRRWLLAIFGVASIGAVGAGLVPLDRGQIHSLSALVAFVFFNIEALATAFVTRGPVRVVSLVAGAIGLAFTVLMAIGDSGNAAAFGVVGHGGTERMIVYPVMIWLMILGGSLSAAGDRHEASDRAVLS
jgi:hypothetical membrane protein